MADNGETDPTDVSSIEYFLAQEADPLHHADSKAYEEEARSDRSVLVRQFLNEELIENAHDHDENPELFVLPILDDDGLLAYPLDELISNREELHKKFAEGQAKSVKQAMAASNPEDMVREQELADRRGHHAEIYFCDYSLLTFVANYSHGLRLSKSEHLKKMDQAKVVNETDPFNAGQMETRRKLLRGLDIIMPGKGYDFSKPLSSEEVFELATEAAKNEDWVISNQVRTSIYGLLTEETREPGEHELRLRLESFRNHDDYKELAHIFSIIAIDVSLELAYVFKSRLEKLIQRIGISKSELQSELDILGEVSEILTRFLADSDN